MNTQQHIHKNISSTTLKNPTTFEKLNYNVAKISFCTFIIIAKNPFAVLVQKNTSPYRYKCQGRFKFKVFHF